MRLASFEVENFRSIQGTERVRLSNFSILVGPNNEGKSNLLKAIQIGLSLLQEERDRSDSKRVGSHIYTTFRSRRHYDWDRDFPKQLAQYTKRKTNFLLEFEFLGEELKRFRKETGIQFNATLPVRITVGREGIVQIYIPKKGPANKQIQAKAGKILNFIANHIDLEYVPAVRSSDSISGTLRRTIRRNLASARKGEEYIMLQEKLQKLEKESIANIRQSITDSFRKFLPDLKGVSVRIDIEKPYDNQFISSSSLSISIDDGVNTPLESKGEGIQSLAAIALIKQTVDSQKGNKQIILAIEEPEAHLHPDSIHKIKNILKELSQTQQVIVSTHSPILVDTGLLSNNIIVKANQAKPARTVDDVRKALGVRIPDNLISAEMVVLVEGKTDERIVEAALRFNSPRITKAIEEKRLRIINLKGAQIEEHEVLFYKEFLLSKILLIVDSDDMGNGLVKKFLESGRLNPHEIRSWKLPHRENCEIEDMFKPEVYVQRIKDKYQVDLLTSHMFKKHAGKWTLRVKASFDAAGVPFESREVKKLVADAVVAQFSENILINETVFKSIRDLVSERMS